jgi:hypothetical protein
MIQRTILHERFHWSAPIPSRKICGSLRKRHDKKSRGGLLYDNGNESCEGHENVPVMDLINDIWNFDRTLSDNHLMITKILILTKDFEFIMLRHDEHEQNLSHANSVNDEWISESMAKII